MRNSAPATVYVSAIDSGHGEGADPATAVAEVALEEMDVGVSTDIVVVTIVDPKEFVVVMVISVEGYSVA